MSSYVKGVAFICEGQTERVFYQSMLEYYLSMHKDYGMFKEQDGSTKDYQLVLTNDRQSIVIKVYTVGTIIAHTQAAANWFKNNCRERYNQIDWTVFLCYDTESHERDVSQFQECDWKELRKSILRSKRTSIVDLAASADIEDMMLLDLNGVCAYLGIPICPMPPGRKGKAKMKRIFRENGSCYHEGERAKPLIDALDKGIIISRSTISLGLIDEICFG